MSERLWTGLVKRGKYWHLRYRLPGETQERRKSLEVRDKRVAEARKREFEEDFEREQDGMPSPNRSKDCSAAGLIAPLLEEFLEQRRTRGTGEEQIGNVRRDVVKVCTELGWTRLRQINDRDYQTWQRSPSVADSSARTKNNRLKNFQSFLGQLVRMKLIGDNPLSSVPLIDGRGVKRRKRRALSDDEIGRLLDRCHRSLQNQPLRVTSKPATQGHFKTSHPDVLISTRIRGCFPAVSRPISRRSDWLVLRFSVW